MISIVFICDDGTETICAMRSRSLRTSTRTFDIANWALIDSPSHLRIYVGSETNSRLAVINVCVGTDLQDIKVPSTQICRCNIDFNISRLFRQNSNLTLYHYYLGLRYPCLKHLKSSSSRCWIIIRSYFLFYSKCSLILYSNLSYFRCRIIF